jgi:Putative heavy-metal-binding
MAALARQLGANAVIAMRFDHRQVGHQQGSARPVPLCSSFRGRVSLARAETEASAIG